MNCSSTSERSYCLIIGLSTFLAVVGFSVSIWSIGSLKYQIKYSNDVQNKLKLTLGVFEERVSQVNSTAIKQNKNFKETLLQLNTTVEQLGG